MNIQEFSSNKIQKYTDWILEGMIPVWIHDSGETDELLNAYINVIANWYLSTLERIDSYKFDNKINYDLYSFMKGWQINNIIDFLNVKDKLSIYLKALGEEEGIQEYRKYILSRFPDIIKNKGTRSILQALMSRLGFTVEILTYVKEISTGKEIAETDIYFLNRGRELWYTDPDAENRTLYPTARVDIIYSLVSNLIKDSKYMYINPDIFIDLNKAVNNMLPFHARKGNVYIKILGVIQQLSPFSSIRQDENETGNNLNKLKEEIIIINNSFNLPSTVARITSDDGDYYYLKYVYPHIEDSEPPTLKKFVYRPLIAGTYFAATVKFGGVEMELPVRWILDNNDISSLTNFSLSKTNNSYILIGNKNDINYSNLECRIHYNGKIEFWDPDSNSYVHSHIPLSWSGVDSFTIKYTYKTDLLFQLKSIASARDRLRIRTL